jgi:hypothetical protein
VKNSELMAQSKVLKLKRRTAPKERDNGSKERR